MDTYEKKYNEALERARTIVENQNASSVWKDWLCNTFPELKSEDERILEIIKHCIESRYLHTSTIKGISQKQCLAWLEKQGQKPAWSEEDENHLESIGWKLLDYTLSTAIPECKKEAKEDCFWLKSLKQRIGG